MTLRTVYTAGLTAALIVIMVAPPAAQMQPVAARASGAIAAGAVENINLLVGRSMVLRTERPIKRVSIPKPEIADALVTSPYEVLVHGKLPGTISLLVWSDNGVIHTYNVSVRRDLEELKERITQLFPGEPIEVRSNGADVVLSGIVSSSYVVDKATSLAAGYVEKSDNVVNLLRQQEGMASNQVLLRVRFAEVSRSAVQELGASFFTGPGGFHDWVGRATTQQFPAPGFNETGNPNQLSGLVFSDFLNLLAFNRQEQLGLVIKALQQKGLLQSLAEPNVVTQNGKEASFLAGGEFPIPVVQGGGANAAVTIVFKEFGVRLRFTPTVIGNDLIHLKVAPEVSALDFSNAVTVEGFRVPALTTRRTETEVELRDGQTFAIAGLIDNSLTQTVSKVPGLGDIPILGLLFKSRAYQKNHTELVVMITPQILRRDSVGVTSDLPRPVEPYLGPEQTTLPNPPPAFTVPPAAAANGPGSKRSAKPAATSAPAAPVAASAPAPVDAGAEERARKKAAEEAKRREAEQKELEAEQEKLEAEQKKAEAAQKKRDAEEAKKREAEHKKWLESEQKRFAADQKKRAEEKKKLEAEQKKAAERQKKAAEEQRKLEEQQRKLDEERREIEERQKKAEAERLKEFEEEQQRLALEASKLAAAMSRNQKKLEEQRAEAERKKAEERKKQQQKAMKKRVLSDPYPPLRSRIIW